MRRTSFRRCKISPPLCHGNELTCSALQTRKPVRMDNDAKCMYKHTCFKTVFPCFGPPHPARVSFKSHPSSVSKMRFVHKRVTSFNSAPGIVTLRDNSLFVCWRLQNLHATGNNENKNITFIQQFYMPKQNQSRISVNLFQCKYWSSKDAVILHFPQLHIQQSNKIVFNAINQNQIQK